jgi:ABC-2 type transport system permease protein
MKDGFADVRDGLQRFQLWLLLAWRDVKRSNVRTRLGVLWHTITFYVVAAGIALLYSNILGQPDHLYVPYLASGLLAWNFITAPFSEGTTVLLRDRGLITQVPTPLSLYIFRFVCKDALILSLNTIGYFLVLLSFALMPSPNLLALAFALVLVVASAAAVTTILAIVSVFHTWLPSLLPSIMRLAFFVTPVLWMPKMILETPMPVSPTMQHLREAAIYLNPLHHYLEVFRGTLVGYPVELSSWVLATGMTVVLCLAAIVTLSLAKTRVLVNL